MGARQKKFVMYLMIHLNALMHGLEMNIYWGLRFTVSFSAALTGWEDIKNHIERIEYIAMNPATDTSDE